MRKASYRDLIVRFIKAEIKLPEFKEGIEDRLFELRQKPDASEEKKLLSNIELRLHEASEGTRPWPDLYEYLKSIVYSKSVS